MDESPAMLSNWPFEVDETSNGVYTVKGRHARGATIEVTGTNLKKLLEEACMAAKSMESETN
jgi:hypothetical protein